MWLILFSICVALSNKMVALGEHVESQGEENFDFGIFENFVSNGRIFQAEVQILNQLRRVKQDLTRVSQALKSRRTAAAAHRLRMVRQLASVHKSSNSTVVHQNLFVNSTTQDPTGILKGATNGLIQLQSTYDLDTDRMAEGYFTGSGFVFVFWTMRSRQERKCYTVGNMQNIVLHDRTRASY